MNNNQKIRTKESIVNAFLKLLDEKKFEDIIIQDILDKTPISRAGFYQHFHDKYEIAEEMQKTILDKFAFLKNIAQLDENMKDKLATIIDIKENDKRTILKIAAIKSDKVDLLENIKIMITEAYLKQYGDNEEIRCEAAIYASSITEIMVYSLKTNKSLNEVLSLIKPIIAHPFLKLLNLHNDEKAKEGILGKKK